MLESKLEELVINDLKEISKKAIKNKKKFIYSIQKPNFEKENNKIEEVVTHKLNRINEIKKIRMSLYEDKVKEIITEEDFVEYSSNYNDEMEQLNSDIQNLQKELNTIKEEKVACNFYTILEKIVDFKIVDKAILIQLIDKIEIFKDKSVKVHYKFRRP